MNTTLLSNGFVLIFIAAAVLGIGLIIALIWKKNTQQTKPVAGAQVVERVFSADKNFQAIIKQRADGKHQVEFVKMVRTDSAEFGPNIHFERINSALTDTMSDAMEIATRYIGERSFSGDSE